MVDVFDKYSHQHLNITPMIYAYRDHILEHSGFLKVGYTQIDVDKRVAQQFPTMTPDGKKPYDIVLRESAMREDGTTFTDRDVHKILEKRGFRQGKSEWFKCKIRDVKSAIVAIKTRKLNIEDRTQNFSMRPEQLDAVETTKRYYENEKRINPHSTPKFLWNAKMRFGKTFASYELAKSMKLKRILILTFKPAVEISWQQDLENHVDFEGWQFYSREVAIKQQIEPNDFDQSKPIVCFGSFQDYLGTNDVGGIKTKNEWVHTINWDIIIFDEYHYGAWRENAQKLFEKSDEDNFESVDFEKYKKDEAGNAYNETFLPITTSYYLYLSGTPFRALNSGEFVEDQIFNWTYGDEQKAKINWTSNKPNPYESLPQMILMTYQIPDDIRKIAYNSQYNEFDLNIFFSAEMPEGRIKDSQFIYKEYVQKWLDLIRGAYLPTTVDDLKLGKGQKPVMPFTDIRLLNVLLHTFWFMPNVASCYAMKNLLLESQNVFYHQYKVNVCAGLEAGVGKEALKPVQESMSNPLKSKTITLSCGKLTTGVTVKPWTGIFMLRNLSSPETYFQAAFRVQSPWTVNNDNGSEEIIKRECYIFDFSLDRALRQVADYSCRLNINETSPEAKVGEFINFLPVLAYDGSIMRAVNAIDILDITMAGTSATLLARKWESALLVNVDNETLRRLLSNKEALEALMNIEGFRSLNKDIETIINKSSAVKKARKDGLKKTEEEKRELSEDEKEYKSKRRQIQEKLIKFATRIPVFMYLTDFREYCLKDVIMKFEPRLFKKVTGINVEDFSVLVSLGLFNDSLMNEAVYKFKRYEDSSLEYTGINKHSEDERIGLFSTVITREEYEHMEDERTLSMITKGLVSRESIEDTSKEIASSVVKDDYILINYNKNTIVTKPEKKRKKLFHISLNDNVVHSKFGKGKVIAIADNHILVKFEIGEKIFSYPSAFNNGWLKMEGD